MQYKLNDIINNFKNGDLEYMLDKYHGSDIISCMDAPKSIPVYLFTYTDKYGAGVFYRLALTVRHSDGVCYFVLKDGEDEAARIINLKSDGTFEILEG